MDSSQSTQEHRKLMGMHIPQLLTPEEPTADSFVQSKAVQPIHPASPPASPNFRSISTEAGFSHPDEVLYPDNTDTTTANDEQPLFEASNDSWDSIDRQNSPQTETSLLIATPSPRNSPVRDPEQLPDADAAVVEQPLKKQRPPVGPVALYNTYGLDYYRYVMAQNEEFVRRRRQLPKPITGARASDRDQYTQKVLLSLSRTRIEKPKVSAQAAAKPKAPRAAPHKATRSNASAPSAASPVVKNDSPVKRHRKSRSTPDAKIADTNTPKARTRNPPSKKVEGIEQDWREIMDFSPPIESLTTKFQAHWPNTNRMNLDDDPDREHLHPQELEVASMLRLRCAQYLANKRRIFAGRLTALQEGKDFNKTSAQNVTSIDVNKASQLWNAFNSVGWFDEKHFSRYL